MEETYAMRFFMTGNGSSPGFPSTHTCSLSIALLTVCLKQPDHLFLFMRWRKGHITRLGQSVFPFFRKGDGSIFTPCKI